MTMPITEIKVIGTNISQDAGTTGARNLIREVREKLIHVFPEINFDVFTHGINSNGTEYFIFGIKTKAELEETV